MKAAAAPAKFQFTIVDLMLLPLLIGILVPIVRTFFRGDAVVAAILSCVAAGFGWMISCAYIEETGLRKILIVALSVLALIPVCCFASARHFPDYIVASLAFLFVGGVMFGIAGNKAICRLCLILGGLELVLMFGLAVASSFFLRSRCGGSNQTAAAASCKAYAEAQEIYRRTDYDGNGILEYAQFLTGNNSLLEQTAGSGNLALIDRTFGDADIINGSATPKAGYIFKILKAQGASAAGGAKSYLDQNGNMTQGYALVACPAGHESTGRDTFIINHHGTIFQKDLGPNTLMIVLQMKEFNPDTTWVPSE